MLCQPELLISTKPKLIPRFAHLVFPDEKLVGGFPSQIFAALAVAQVAASLKAIHSLFFSVLDKQNEATVQEGLAVPGVKG